MQPLAGVIAAVERGSLARRAGLRPGDRLLSVNGHALRDVIDVQFYGADDVLDLRLERDGQGMQLRIERDYDRPLGLTFTNPTFDVDVRRCANDCDFCFVKMNPPGMRRSLYVKDDDLRYSFLFGNFCTLTNLTAADWARLGEQRLSPLYVSVHATDLALRRRFLGCKSAPDVMDQLRRLAGLGIEVHTQVVLVPGLNDGDHLDQTLSDLSSLYEDPVLSAGVVPVGLTRYHPAGYRPYTPAESAAVLDQVEPWRVQSRQRWGAGFVYPSDEWYLVAGRGVPHAAEYDDLPQVENGIGMVRLLLDEWQTLKNDDEPDLRGWRDRPIRPATLVCGTLIAPVLRQIVGELTCEQVRLAPVVNQTFGAVTTVSGLLTGRDVVEALRGRELGDVVLLPRAMFTGRYGAGDAPPGITLDDMTLAQIADRLEVRVEMAGTLTEALAVLTG